MLAKRGFHGMSMRELAKALGRTPAGFYNYYASKEDLLFDLQLRAFETLADSARAASTVAGPPSARLYAFILQHVQYVAQNHAVMQILVQEAHALPAAQRKKIRAAKERFYRIGHALVAAVLQTSACSGRARRAPVLDALEVERQTYALFGMLNWTYGWYEPERHGTPQELARTLHRFALCGLRPDCPVHAGIDEVDEQLIGVRLQPLFQLAPRGNA